MSTTTMRQHSPAELTYDCTIDDLVYFHATSTSEPGRLHSVSYSTVSSRTECSCKAAIAGRQCWHQDLARAAYLVHCNRQRISALSNERLDAEAMGLRRHLEDAERMGQEWVAANLRGLLDLVRQEYKRRCVAA